MFFMTPRGNTYNYLLIQVPCNKKEVKIKLTNIYKFYIDYSKYLTNIQLELGENQFCAYFRQIQSTHNKYLFLRIKDKNKIIIGYLDLTSQKNQVITSSLYPSTANVIYDHIDKYYDHIIIELNKIILNII